MHSLTNNNTQVLPVQADQHPRAAMTTMMQPAATATAVPPFSVLSLNAGRLLYCIKA